MKLILGSLPFLFCGIIYAGNGGDLFEDLSGDVSDLGGESDDPGGIPVFNTFSVEADYDGLFSGDIIIQRYNTNLEWERGKTNLGLGYTYNIYDVDFSNPTDLLSGSRKLDEENHTLTFTAEREWTDFWSTNLSLTGYTGFTDFRSIWISEFFREDQGDLPGYSAPDPFGFSVGIGNTFVLPNEIDSIRLDLGYSRDRIAPGFEREFASFAEVLAGQPFETTVASDDDLDTVSVGLTGNFYVTNKITTQWLARASFISDREVRTQFRVSAAWSPFNRLNFRGEFGASFEPSSFEAYYGGGSANIQVSNSLTWSVGFRVYTDSGEITTSNFNTAAPGIDTQEISSSLRWSKGSHSVLASVAYLQTDFDEIASVENQPFANLFRDRNFIAVRAAYSYEF